MSHKSEKSSCSPAINNDTQTSGQGASEKPSASKRTMLKFAWTAPLVMAINLPPSSFASNVSGRQGSDGKDRDDRDEGKDKDKRKGPDKHIGNNQRRAVD